MPTFRVTEQTTSLVERSYDIEAPDAEAAQERYEDIDGEKFPVHVEVIAKNVEIINVEEV